MQPLHPLHPPPFYPVLLPLASLTPSRYAPPAQQASGLKYRHIDNINIWFHAMQNVGMPQVWRLRNMSFAYILYPLLI